MVKLKTNSLTPLGKVIAETGLSLNFIIDKSGINRNRLVQLRTSDKSSILFSEAVVLAPVLKMSLDELSKELFEEKTPTE
jgi:hypothetical protein